ncbi:MAG: 3-phosphoshikimate 1-carboxyvinyltransferase [Candidatus Latescibacteria bacterium]|nr:3-phosphoshikimate 1-carboxyvinyltransferase [Candidatus Latescibacterota bacterium]NIM64401.1 3-phosphoshikimate 1-carboxyvinyltransferase [Candidatus Latescibacterota bacterium]NIO00555.1 3-phosphoshikimate 1-carboxyvinyltransferase [Candidatus Latescibacterota bacterium]NIO26955.1 3-phosphoshikimate 1-carboxyvinyltransferase [Candidatus Latescibacterota bacterium]NIO56032.1 3-phosphoshikimate 1-carboxyvinyltransferase [Candidatus Latescibacterota bacterium]
MDTSVQKATKIRGTLRVPGDKSIAHRALILGALARGKQVIEGIPRAEDVGRTASCLRTLGCFVEEMPDGQVLTISKRWITGQNLDAGNSATAARLLLGLAAGKGLDCIIDGDESLRKRPMSRVVEPLRQMGADIHLTGGDHLPLQITRKKLSGITYRMPMPSAQVKSAVLIAGLSADGDTTVIEEQPSRDHTENLLEAMEATISRDEGTVTVTGGSSLKGIYVTVPADISSALFFITAAVCLSDSEIYFIHTGVNPTRTGAIKVLQEMGADISIENVDTEAGEPAGDIIARSSSLHGIDIDPALVPTLIDELPILAVAATQAEGVTTVRGAGELRHKESDRIRAIVQNLSLLGAKVTELEDGFSVMGPCSLKGRAVSSFGDHRIAMASSIAGLFAEGTTRIENSDVVGVSYPDFYRDLITLAA